MSIRDLEIFENLNPPAEEAYRALRTNLQFCVMDKNIKVIALTSSEPNEGKTTTATNLAISISKTDTKVLLVDADLRKAMFIKGVSMSRGISGLSSYLSGVAEFDEILKSTNVPNLSIVFCGHKPPNPSELLSRDRFKEFLNTAKERFDMIIIDTPPLGGVIDCAIIAAQTDGVIIVVAANTIEYKRVQRVKEQLEKANANILGVVLNKLTKNEYKGYYKYYDYYSSVKHLKRVPWSKRIKKLK